MATYWYTWTISLDGTIQKNIIHWLDNLLHKVYGKYSPRQIYSEGYRNPNRDEVESVEYIIRDTSIANTERGL